MNPKLWGLVKPIVPEIADATVTNWEEVRVWAKLNDPLWNRLETEARILNMTELEFLRWTAGKLLESRHELLEKLIECHEHTATRQI